MKLPLISLLALVSCAMGQGSRIGSPLAGANLKLGGPFTVQVIRNVRTERVSFNAFQLTISLQSGLQSSTEVGMAICMLSCPTSSTGPAACPTPQSQLGDCLYSGPFNPTTRLETGGGLYENFTLTAPSTENFFVAGRAQLAVARLHLIGVRLSST